MLFFKTNFHFTSQLKLEKLIYNLKGITEEKEDKNYIIPTIIYKLKGEIIENDFKLKMNFNRIDYILNGKYVNENNVINFILSAKSSKLDRIYFALVFLILIIIVLFTDPDDYQFMLSIIVFLVLGVFVNQILAILKLKRIFNKICNDNFGLKELKYFYMN